MLWYYHLPRSILKQWHSLTMVVESEEHALLFRGSPLLQFLSLILTRILLQSTGSNTVNHQLMQRKNHLHLTLPLRMMKPLGSHYLVPYQMNPLLIRGDHPFPWEVYSCIYIYFWNLLSSSNTCWQWRWTVILNLKIFFIWLHVVPSKWMKKKMVCKPLFRHVVSCQPSALCM